MNKYTIYISIGVICCAAVGYALYRYFKRSGSNPNFKFVESLSYGTIIKWVKEQCDKGIIQQGDSLHIVQDAVAHSLFNESFPKNNAVLKDHKCISVLIAGDNDDVRCGIFFVYNELSLSLQDILPEDETKILIQKIKL